MTLGNEEKLSSQESMPKRIIKLGIEVLDSVEFAAADIKANRLADKIKAELEALESSTPTNLRVGSRKLRAFDTVRRGEHPGVRITADFPDQDLTLDVNIYGGIRDPKSLSDLQETTHRVSLGESHETRTLGLGDKLTQINVQLKKAGLIVSEFWIKDTPGNRPAVAISTLRTTSDEEITGFTGIDKPIVFPIGSVYYRQFHENIRGIVSDLIKLLP